MFRSLFEWFKEIFRFIQESKVSEFVVRFGSNLDIESKFQSVVNIMSVVCAGY
ncbi:hypothetical protein Salpa_1939 [Sporomusa sp. KB1]|jgi:hypothetical protein|nr:hypothetical protein Salpa_1939 [Sporomusa sp. KB1]